MSSKRYIFDPFKRRPIKLSLSENEPIHRYIMQYLRGDRRFVNALSHEDRRLFEYFVMMHFRRRNMHDIRGQTYSDYKGGMHRSSGGGGGRLPIPSPDGGGGGRLPVPSPDGGGGLGRGPHATTPKKRFIRSFYEVTPQDETFYSMIKKKKRNDRIIQE